jgi:hypothetical protein
MAICTNKQFVNPSPAKLDLRHIVVKNGLFATIIPFDGYARPIFFSDRALIVLVGVPANAVAEFELPGLVAGHFGP